MKKTIMLLLLLIIAGIVLAQEKPLTDKEVQDIAKDPQKLADAIDTGKVFDFSVITGSQLAGALSQKPSIVEKLDYTDLARAVESKSDLLSNNDVFKVFDTYVKGDTSIVNDNPDAKKAWLARLGIDDQGAKIHFYDGTIIITEGQHSTQFVPSDFKGPPNPQVLPKGELVIPAGATIMSNGKKIEVNSDITISGAAIATSSNEYNVIISLFPPKGVRTVVTFGNKIFASDSEFYFGINNKENFIEVESGYKELKITDLSEKTRATISGGAVNFYGDGHMNFGVNSGKTALDYKTYDWNTNAVISSIHYETLRDAPLLYYNTQDGCAGILATCIAVVGHDMSISQSGDAGNNNLVVNRYNKDIASLNVKGVTAGRVVYNDNGVVQYDVTPGGVVVYGDASKGTDISLTWKDEEGEIHTQSISKSDIEQCSICKKIGKFSDLALDVISSTGEMLTNNHAAYDKFKQDAEDKWGIAPMAVAGYFDDAREERVVNALLATSERTGLDINLLTASVFQEGLNMYMDKRYYDDPSAPVDGFDYLGTDYFVYDINELKQKGYLRQDFKEFDTSTVERTEAGGKVELTYPIFNNVDYAIEAFGAELKLRRDTFLSDAQSIGLCGNKKCEDTLTEDQLNAGTYMYYNSGAGTAKAELKKRGLDFVNAVPEPKENSLINAKRVGATVSVLKNAGFFKKVPS